VSILDTIGLLVSKLASTRVISEDGDVLINLDMAIVE
jgi:hypothetical protein